MESFANIDVINVGNCYKLSCVINNTPVTPFKWVVFINKLDKALKRIGEDDTIQKFYMYYDVTFIDVMMKHEKYKDITKIFENNSNLFIDKLLGTFIYIESSVLNICMKIFMKFYSPVRPLFILKTKSIDTKIVNDLLENRKNDNEYNIR